MAQHEGCRLCHCRTCSVVIRGKFNYYRASPFLILNGMPRIGAQIDHHLLYLLRIGKHLRHVGRTRKAEGHAGGLGRTQ